MTTPKRGARLLVPAICALSVTAGLTRATAQQRRSTVPANHDSLATSKGSKKPALEEATRVSTDQAVRNAAQSASAKRDLNSESHGSAPSEVLEFQPVTNPTTPASKTTGQKESKKLAPKNIHGTVYGSLDSGKSETHSGGAAAGVGSKSGKSHIYVETERSRTSSPR